MAAALDRIIKLQPMLGTAVPPLGGSVARPLISVVLPVYEPNRFLIDALTSVLSQDLGGAEMQIAVVDDASPTCDVNSLVDRVAPPGRVEVYRVAENQGLARNWNECVRVARGHVVHILHQDDWVARGFYKRLLPAFAKHPTIGMAFCRHAIVEGVDGKKHYSHREKLRPGVLANWLEKITERQRIQCASVLVLRSVYEQLGGYCPDLCYALDWEMWVRIAARFDVWYEPRKLACYRRHSQSESNRLLEGNRASRDEIAAIEIFANHLPSAVSARLVNAAYVRFIGKSLKQLRKAASNPQQDVDDLLKPIRDAIARLVNLPGMAARFSKDVAQLERGKRV